MTVIRSIHSRLSRTLWTISLIWTLAITAAVLWVVKHEVEELLDDALMESAQILRELVVFDLTNRSPGEREQANVGMQDHDERLIWQLVDEHNQIVTRSHKAGDEALLPVATLGFSDANSRWRVFGLRLPDHPDWVLYVAQDSEERREAGLEVVEYTASTVLVIGLLCVLMLRYRLRRELRPLSEFSNAVRHFDPLDSQSELQPVTRAELEPMHRAITSLGAGLAQRIENERAFSAHAAHALRTPLAGMDAQLAMALRESPPEVHPRLIRTRAAASRLRQVVTALLALFRSGSAPHWQPISMRQLVATMTFHDLTVEVSGEDALDADPDLLAAALMNLIDNSARHRATRVSIEVIRNVVGVSLLVHDNGTGIADDKLAHLQAAIVDQSYSEKTGLGLMLADMVARAHGGRLLLHDDADGCTVEIQLAQQP